MNHEPSWLATITAAVCSFTVTLGLGCAYIWVVGL